MSNEILNPAAAEAVSTLREELDFLIENRGKMIFGVDLTDDRIIKAVHFLKQMNIQPADYLEDDKQRDMLESVLNTERPETADKQEDTKMIDRFNENEKVIMCIMEEITYLREVLSKFDIGENDWDAIDGSIDLISSYITEIEPSEKSEAYTALEKIGVDFQRVAGTFGSYTDNNTRPLDRTKYDALNDTEKEIVQAMSALNAIKREIRKKDKDAIRDLVFSVFIGHVEGLLQEEKPSEAFEKARKNTRGSNQLESIFKASGLQ